MSLLSLLKLCCLLVCVTSENVIQTVASTLDQNLIKCTDSSCNITCLADHSCTSLYSHDTIIPFEIHCTSDTACSQCNIHCYGEHSCEDAFIYVYACSSVTIIATQSYSLYGATIITDKRPTDDMYEGNLFISNNVSYLSSDSRITSNIMSHTKVQNEYFANVSIDCYGDSLYSTNECTHLSITKNTHSRNISLNCHQNTDCSASALFCPVNNIYDETNNDHYQAPCNVNCGDSAVCHNISVYAERGIPADFWFDCNSNDSCADSTVFCGKQYQSNCGMTYNYDENEWFCNDRNDKQSCADIEWIYKIQNPTRKVTSFWTETYYGIPMTVLAAIIILCLFVVIVKMIREKVREHNREYLPYEMEDARDLDEQNALKTWLRSMCPRFMRDPYDELSRDDVGGNDAQSRIELQNLNKMTRDEVYESDDDLEFDGVRTGHNSNDTAAYN